MKKLFFLFLFCAGAITTFAQGNSSNSGKPEKIAKNLHSQTVVFLGMSPDGKYNISAGHDFSIKLWQGDSFNPVKNFSGHVSSVQVVTMSLDGKYMLSGSDEGSAILWDVASGTAIQRVKNYNDGVTGVAFSTDANTHYFYTGGEDGKIQIYDRMNGCKFINSIQTEGDGIAGMGLPYGSKNMIIICKDGKMREYDLKTSALLRTFEGSHSDEVKQFALSPDGKYAVTCSDDKRVMLWDIAAGKMDKTFEGHEWKVLGVAFSPNGQYIASCSIDATVRLWSVADGKELKKWYAKNKKFQAVTFTPDSKYVISAVDHVAPFNEDLYWWPTGLDFPVPAAPQATPEDAPEAPTKTTPAKNAPVRKPAPKR